MDTLANIKNSLSYNWAIKLFVSLAITLLSAAPTSAQESRINYFYDDLGRLIRVVDESGNAATYHYDAVGNILRITRETGVPTTATVTNVSASSVDRGTATIITITGFNLFCAPLSSTTPGVTLSNVQTAVDQIVATVTVSAAAQVGPAAIQLNCDGGPITVPFAIIDTAPTVSITSPAEGATVFEATEITLTAEAADNVQVSQLVWTVNGAVYPPVFARPYAQVVSIPYGTTSVTIQATATDNIGQNGTATRTLAVQPDPGPSVAITTPPEGATLIEGQQIELTADARDNRQVASVVWTINGVIQSALSVFPYRFALTVPANISSLTLLAMATDDLGYTGSATRTVAVIPDPRTTVIGRLLDINNQPFAGATVKVFDQFTAQSLADGTFSIPGVPTIRGDITAIASADVAGTVFRGISISMPPVIGGTTNVGLIILKPEVKEPIFSGIAFSTGKGPRSVLAVDLNGDGKVDIVTANADSSDLSVLLGNGGGTFQPEKRFAAGDGISRGPTSLAFGDLNGDGEIDLVSSNTFVTNTASVLLGNGDGTFQSQQRIGVGKSPSAAAVADLNGDGKLDIITANTTSGDVSVLLGNGDGSFQVEQRFQAGDGAFAGPISVTVADVNSDGRPDLVAGILYSTNLAVLLGNGDGTFTAQQRFPAGIFVGPVKAGDLNGDGKADLVLATASTSNQISTVLGNGDGTFQAPQVLTVGASPSSLAMADIDSDGKLDVVTANLYSGDVSVLLGSGDGTFLPEMRFAVGTSPSSIALANVNGDSHLDLITTDRSLASVSVLFGRGDGTFQTRERLAVGNGPAWVIVADLNADGIQDLVAVNNVSNDISVLFGNGVAAFQAEQRVPVGIRPTAVAAADLDGDGTPDLIVTNSNSNNVSVLPNNGSGTEQRLAVGGYPSAIDVADLNGDGNFDLITANMGSNDISVLLGNGNGTFQAQLRYAAMSSPNSIASGDLNGDGKRDVVVTTEVADNVAVLFGNGDGSFQLPQRLTAGSGTRGVALADVNGDLKLDIIVANTFSDDVSVLLGNGDGTFQPQQTIALGDVNPRAVKVIDVDGDGKPDILTANDMGSLSLLLGNGDGTFLAPQAFVTGGLTRSLAVADLNGDGKPDVVTVDNFRNQLSVLFHR